jgi:hypothetical protein
MEEKDKDINIVFRPQVGFGKILFSFNEEKEILNVLGTFTERSIDIFNEDEYAIYLDYWNISISLYYEYSKFDYLSIHTQDIVLEEFRFSEHEKRDILSFIKKYHDKHHLGFVEDIDYNKNTKEICYYYRNIGLTIWFDKNGISGINVQKS